MTPHARRTIRWATFFFAIALPLIFAALLQVSLRQQAVALGYRLSRAEQRRESLRADIRKAELERAAGRTPRHLAEVAKKLGMVPPSPQQLLSSKEKPYALRFVAAPKAKTKPNAQAMRGPKPPLRNSTPQIKPAKRAAARPAIKAPMRPQGKSARDRT